MDSGNNSSSLQSSSGGGDEEFDSRTFFATSINASATNNANSNGFTISNSTTTTTTNNNNNFPNFLDNFSFLVPASSFQLLLDPRGSSDDPAPAKTAATPASRPSTTLSSSPRSSTTTSSRKRSRASRRAPTTVLTTDTSNFRAMVQEFTGIPSPPFSSSSASPYPPPPRSRFDFFNPAFINAASAGATPSPSFFLLKPFHFPNAHAAATAANINYLPQQPPSPSNFCHNNSQSLLQTMPSASTAAADHYGSAAGDLGQLTGAIGSGWGQDAGVDPTSLSRQVSNGACKLNYSAAAEFGAEKGGEARGEGMVESWICSSD